MAEFSGYRDLKKISEGPERIVYSALRLNDKEPVILKALRSEHPNPETIALMYHEYEVAKSLNLPGVIKTFDLIDQNNTYALVQEDMQGISLLDYLAKYPLKDLQQFFKLAIPMARIIADVHQNHIIHKDIKPSNFIIHPETLFEKLTDFNYSSKLLREVQDIVPPHKLEGTLAYMAPEQTGRMNMNIDYRSDFYSLGVTYYEMLSCELPFLFNDPLELLHAHLANPAPPAHSAKFDIPPIVVKIIQKLMAKNPRDRYQSAIGLLSDLERCEIALKNTGKIEDFVLGQKDVFDRLNLSQKLYGREKEAQSLLAAYDRVSEGSVEALMVCGYSGIGKTMLISEVHKPMVKHKGYFISGKFDQLQRDTPYTAITQAFNQLARLILAEPEERFVVLKKAIVESLGNVAQVMIDLAPDLELILGPQPPLEKLPSQETQNRMKIFFKRFLQAIASQDHPLVIFIDDLQWIDSGSLNLMEFLMSDEEFSHILLIGAYRDNEVDAGHPLRKWIENIEAAGKREIQSMPLNPLTVADFTAFLRDSFNREPEAVQALAELIHKRTNGNPFFCKQVINLLYREKYLFFDYEKLRWDWSLENIISLKITDNVVDLMLRKLAELPEETQNLLKFAACVGNRFTIEMLMGISGKSADEVGKALWPALQQELLITLRLGYKRMEGIRHENLAALLAKDITYQFVHDRVQQAVYQVISEEEKQKTHLTIARSLLKNDPQACKKERLFEVTDHFNMAQPILTSEEKVRAAEFNYDAGIRALNSNAYKPMRNYLAAGLKLGDDSWWKQHYELFFKINRAYIQSLYLMGESKEIPTLVEKLLEKAKTTLDKVSIYRIQCVHFASINEAIQAINIAFKALSLLGINLKMNPSFPRVLLKIYQIKWALRGNKIPTLDQDLKKISDSNISAALEILSDIIMVSLWMPGNLFTYLGLVSMQLMLRYGASTNAGLWVSLYAMAILYIQNDVKNAFALWSVAERFIEKTQDKYSAANCYQFRAYHFNHMRFPFQDANPYYQKAIQSARESGNLIIFGVSLCVEMLNKIAEAKSITDIEKHVQNTLNYLRIIHFQEPIAQMELKLLQIKGERTLVYDDANLLKIYQEVLDGHNFHIQMLEIMSMAAHFFFREDYAAAYEYHKKWYVDERKMRYAVVTYTYKAIDALTIAKLIPSAPAALKKHYFKQFRALCKELKWASENSSHNYLHLYELLLGVDEQLKGHFDSALRLFHQAIEHAKKGDFYLWVAVINECAIDLFVGRDLIRAASDYIRESHYYYQRYGLTEKTRQLEKRYPEQFAALPEMHRSQMASTTTSTTTSASLDFMSLIKASQAISGEIVLDSLFEKMLKIVVENAGAQKAFFLENRKNNWVLTSALETQTEQENFKVFNTPLKEFTKLPQSIIQFVIRSKETVVLKNASEDDRYRQDPYIIMSKPQSILCLPIIYQDKVIGIIYLENNLTAGAFTQERVTILTTLASQIAISLENARNFEARESLYRSTERFVPKAFLNLLKKATIEDIQVGDSVKVNLAPMFADIRNFTTISEEIGTEGSAFLLNSYLQVMTPIIRRNKGLVSHFLGDGILALFPRAPADALNAALQMHEALPGYNEMLISKGFKPIEIGIGIHAGSAMLITLGEEERLDLSVISDEVNSTSRIEGLNKVYGTSLLLSDSVYSAVSHSKDYWIRPVDKVKVKGKKRAIFLYEAFLPNLEESDLLRKDLAIYQSAFDAYQAGDFKLAAEIFTRYLDKKPKDSVASVLKMRCEEFLKNGAPKDWDGTFTALEK